MAGTPFQLSRLRRENSPRAAFFYLYLALGDHRSGGLAFADKATTQAQSRHDQRQCQCNLLHGTPHRVIRPSYTDMGPPSAIVPKSHSAYEYAAGRTLWEGPVKWSGKRVAMEPSAGFREGGFLLKAACISDGLEVQRPAFCQFGCLSLMGISRGVLADRCAMYEAVGWVIAISAVSLVALHVLLVLGVMSAIQLMDALGRSRQPDAQ